jgi:hypothetical protein
MEHSIDLSAKHFVNAVAPSSTQKLLKKIKHAFEGVELDNDLDLDALDARLAECNFEDVEEEEDEGSGETFEMGDSIGKALALVKQAGGL